MKIFEKAPAKLNLGLDIKGRCDDGYHELAMIMVSIDLNDYVTISELKEDCIVIDSDSSKMPLNNDNDVFKAADIIKNQYGINKGVHIRLEKSIPVCAGLGGGSTDAATIRALNRLWNLQMDYDEMVAIGFKIGSDVPYCLGGGCSLVLGKGEIVKPLPTLRPCWIVLVKPDFGISTKSIFRDIDCKSISRVDIDLLKSAILSSDYQLMVKSMGNSLEDITITKNPVISTIKERMLNSGADVALMTGSGPTVFSMCSTEKKADRVFNSMKGFCKEVYKVRLLR
ncbi:TPA: 4-(cytidine 5'-diphospho)-2-C-methyl-D-erythritol kinase [Streptococcus agalactiae]|uniref:4-(cytidine 5'-diphospho)-2-C-methyl-D-erythritol kinase n=1 Tax=Streptococcus agalactiae TaxID=1311 RepID=UPI0013FCFDA2|nr:4-(cytidine 5'-diphospho)-2-C-methyl-D-erythritol kinase [Streptococcus agalactiae]HEN3075940.1 4-(cytidine 5'-diphospho)-2-C-methyl-D-erythritol kinase [Streptococcus agalactiae]HEN9237380.1 4-(cytidine 5'-diphospho)-2-C-methyl-D-erythritol kinase [Streptococcus agalactiae]HEN9856600.1 4-(cytidine 5'-diphospho)-2-C-methyl-D-erythritol kinase [Streptococcus agalactiae]HEO3449893.1 4-(cytidine 5'-diphospho)-2-C-methyl-D-erythritol kinase [Streptococcus agalactiae]HEO3720306.1 4-(cytidine 5'-